MLGNFVSFLLSILFFVKYFKETLVFACLSWSKTWNLLQKMKLFEQYQLIWALKVPNETKYNPKGQVSILKISGGKNL